MYQKDPTIIDKVVGQRIKWRRREVGLSQEQLGEQLELTFQQVQKYEKGVNRISAGRLYEIAKVLDVPVGYFFDSLEDVSDVSAPALNADAVELIALFNSIGDSSVRANIKTTLKITAGALRCKNRSCH